MPLGKLQINLPEWVHKIATVFRSSGQPVYAVGGSVRNSILGLPLTDVDICGNLAPNEVEELFSGVSNMRVIPRAVEFGTVEIQVFDGHKWQVAEYTTFRKDSYRNGHRPESVKFTSSIEEDSLRRDFSMNAIYWDINSGTICDPAHGMAALDSNTIRATTPDPMQMIKDDGQRILRMIRFASELSFSIDEELAACAMQTLPLLYDISPERITMELKKILLSDVKYESLGATVTDTLGRGLTLLWEYGLLQRYLGTEDSKTISAACHCPASLAIRLSVLCADNVQERLKNLRFENKVISDVLGIQRTYHQMIAYNSPLPPYEIALTNGKATSIACGQMLKAYGNDKANLLNDAITELDARSYPWVASNIPVTGQDVLKIVGSSGPIIGRLIKKAWLDGAKDPMICNREAMSNHIKKLLEENNYVDPQC